jgi:hypothetical protein
MDGSVTPEQAHQWLQEIADDGWISLHFDNPMLAGRDAAEVIGAGYLRVKMAWSQPSNQSIWSLKDARFTGLNATKVTHFGVWNKDAKGMLRAYAEFSSPKVVMNGKGLVLVAGSIAISVG